MLLFLLSGGSALAEACWGVTLKCDWRENKLVLKNKNRKKTSAYIGSNFICCHLRIMRDSCGAYRKTC